MGAVLTSLALAVAAALPANVLAFDLDYDLGTNLRYSDNINLSDAAPLHDTVLEPTVAFTIKQTGANVQISGRGQLQYLDYRRDTFQDEFRGGFSGGLDWAIVPSRLNLVFQDYLSQQDINDLDQSTPDNLQQVNLFVAGPSFYARLGPATRGQFDLRYGNTYAEETEAFNGDRYSAAARVSRQLSQTAEISGNLEAASIEYDPAGADANYERYDAYLGFKLQRTSASLVLEVGHSQLDRSRVNDSVSAPLLRGTATWNLSQRSQLRLDFRHQYADATQYLITPKLDFGENRFTDLNYADVRVDPDVFRERSVRLAYEFTGARTAMRVQPYYQRSDYFNPLAEDQNLKGVAFDVQYRLRPLVSLSLFVLQERHDYEALSRNDKDTRIDVGLTKRFTRHWSAGAHVRHRKRDSSIPEQGYSENVALLSVQYNR